MFKQPLFVTLVLFGLAINGLEIPILSDIQDLIGLAHDVGDIASGNVPLAGLVTGAKDPVQLKLDGLSKQIQELSEAFHLKMDNALTQILTNVPRETDFRVRMGQLGQYMARISFLFDMYQAIIENIYELDQFTIDQFVEAATSLHYGDVIETLNQMHRLFTGRQDDDTQESLIQLAGPVYAAMPVGNMCGKPKSRQQRVLDIYRTVVFTEFKGFIMTSYAYGLLGIYQNKTFSGEIKIAERRLISRASEYLESTKAGLVDVPRDVYVCDPKLHVYDKTFVEMTRAIQLTVIHENMMISKGDKVQESFKCKDYCSGYDTSTIHRIEEQGHLLPLQPCEGRMTDCWDLGETYFCSTDNEDMIERIVYVKTEMQGRYGDVDRCFPVGERNLETFKSDLWQCEPCMCVCYEWKANSTADRTINLRPQVSDIDNNMVVTGLGFVKINKVIHLQIEQGKLIGKGKIEEGSAKWLPVDDYGYKPELGEGGGFKRWVKWDGFDAVEGEDYAFINFDRRKIHLDDITVSKPGFVVTGVKLKISTQDSNAFALSVRFTKFNYTTGELTDYSPKHENSVGIMDNSNTNKQSYWVDDDFKAERSHIKRDRTFIEVKNKKDPFGRYGHVPSSDDHSEIKITHSNDRDDVGQITIPYFDMQRSGPMPRVALDGLGLYHRSNGETGGFIGIKTMTHDLSLYMNSKIDPNLMRKGELKSIQAKDAIAELE